MRDDNIDKLNMDNLPDNLTFDVEDELCVQFLNDETEMASDNAEDCSFEEPKIIDTSHKKTHHCSKKIVLPDLRIQFIAAIILTVLTLISIPAIAWFARQKEIAVSTKVNSPATLEIKAGGHPGEEQSIINFDLSDIDTEDKNYPYYEDGDLKYYYKDFVFCVKGKAISMYDLQLAHTTNIAFKYEIYRAIQDDAGPIVYTSLDKTVIQRYSLRRVKPNGSGGVTIDPVTGNVQYEDWIEPLDGKYINNANAEDPNKRVIAQTGGDTSWAKDLTSRSYDQSDGKQKYANPVYWLKRGIPVYTEEKTDEGFTHSYVLRISWIMPESLTDTDREEKLDIVQNNKETDMIYITAAVN